MKTVKKEAMVTKIKKKRGVIFWAKPSTLSLVFSTLALVSLLLALIALGVPIVPEVWYRIRPQTVSALGEILKRQPVSFGDLLVEEGEREVYQPEIDPNLTLGHRLTISSIGVDTEILEESYDNFEQALRQGVWRTPDFGGAYARKLPMILVAHRYGYLAWSNQYRRENSFYNLPKLKEGDKVIVDWDQRRYVYVIYGGEEGEKVTDYTADLVLYTCQFLESPVRIFKYARLVKE